MENVINISFPDFLVRVTIEFLIQTKKIYAPKQDYIGEKRV